MRDFEGKTALVTGGTTGIGLAIARAFGAAGARVTAAGLGAGSEPGLDMRELDVTSDHQVRELLAGFQKLDFVVNCAGVIHRDKEYEIETFQRVLDVNLSGTMRISVAARALSPQATEHVNIASMLDVSVAPVFRLTARARAESRLTARSRSHGPGRIRVNAVAPGWITTPLTHALHSNAERSAPILARTPMGRWGKPEEVAGAVLFLCSPAAAFITGAILPVDGGYSAA